jgi:hypothetical protein
VVTADSTLVLALTLVRLDAAIYSSRNEEHVGRRKLKRKITGKDQSKEQ